LRICYTLKILIIKLFFGASESQKRPTNRPTKESTFENVLYPQDAHHQALLQRFGIREETKEERTTDFGVVAFEDSKIRKIVKRDLQRGLLRSKRDLLTMAYLRSNFDVKSSRHKIKPGVALTEILEKSTS